MDHGEHLAGWRREADTFAGLLDGADLTLPVPGCPEWDVADLAYHVGWVFDRLGQWAANRWTERDQVARTTSIDRPEDDAVLPGWFREQVTVLDPILAGLGPDEQVWNFTRTSHVGAWFPRRLHHEVVVHRHDLQDAIGVEGTLDPRVAVDGIDELLSVLSTAGKRWDGERAVVFAVEESSSGRSWRLRLDPGERVVPADPEDQPAVTMSRDAPGLLQALWRRRALDTVTVDGDSDVAAAVLAAIGR